MIAVTVALAMSFVACDKIAETVKDLEEVQEDQAPVLTESKDGLTVTLTYRVAGIGQTIEAKFEVVQNELGLTDTVCCSYTTTQVFALKSQAELTFKIMKDEELTNKELADVITMGKDGKSIIIDSSKEMKGVSKIVVVTTLEYTKKGVESDINISDWLDD